MGANWHSAGSILIHPGRNELHGNELIQLIQLIQSSTECQVDWLMDYSSFPISWPAVLRLACVDL